MYESAPRADNSVVGRIVTILRQQPSGLLTDVDGTICPIAPTPAEARVLPPARKALRRLRRRLALVAIVTGRPVLGARRLLRVAGVAYVGNHGLEFSTTRGSVLVREARPWPPRLAAALADLRPLLDRAGIVVESKGVTASIHYRLSADREMARRDILRAIAGTSTASVFRVEEGRLVVNLLPPIDRDKGTAVRALARRRSLRGLVYFGDDVTDVHAFRALADLRANGEAHALSVAVVTPETAPPVSAAADVVLPSPQAVAAVLSAVVDRLEADVGAIGLPRTA